MRCLLFAYSEIGTVGLETLLELGDTVCGVVTHADNPQEQRWWRSVEDAAMARKIPVITPEDPNIPEVLAWAKERQPDIVFSFYYRKMLKRPLLDVARLGAFNLHGSLLPKFRGRAPVNWAILEGAKVTGLTLHEMVEKPDAGDIIGQEAVPILEHENARDVFEKLVPAARQLLTKAVPLLREGRAPRLKQVESEASYYGARKPEDGRLDWNAPATRVHNMVRALTQPYPGAFTFLGGKKLFIWKGSVSSKSTQELAGKVLGPMDNGVGVATGDGIYVVHEVGWGGESVQNARDILDDSVKGLIFEIEKNSGSSSRQVVGRDPLSR
jgi:methionyl-tRNA formyltransferase